MANWRMNQKTANTPEQLPAEADPTQAVRTRLHAIADTLRDLTARESAARDEQYRLVRQMLAEGATWDQAQFAAEVSRPTIMRAVRDGKRRLADAEAAEQAQRDAERAAFDLSMGEQSGLSPRP
jgi:citrate synthase